MTSITPEMIADEWQANTDETWRMLYDRLNCKLAYSTVMNRGKKVLVERLGKVAYRQEVRRRLIANRDENRSTEALYKGQRCGECRIPIDTGSLCKVCNGDEPEQMAEFPDGWYKRIRGEWVKIDE